MTDDLPDSDARILARAHNKAQWGLSRFTARFWLPLYVLYTAALFAILYFSGAWK